MCKLENVSLVIHKFHDVNDSDESVIDNVWDCWSCGDDFVNTGTDEFHSANAIYKLRAQN